jgi:hypothetical protein
LSNPGYQYKEKSRFHTGSPDDEIANAFIPGAQKCSEANLLTASSSFAAEQDLSANPLQMTHLLYWFRAPGARKRSKENRNEASAFVRLLYAVTWNSFIHGTKNAPHARQK